MPRLTKVIGEGLRLLLRSQKSDRLLNKLSEVRYSA